MRAKVGTEQNSEKHILNDNPILSQNIKYSKNQVRLKNDSYKVPLLKQKSWAHYGFEGLGLTVNIQWFGTILLHHVACIECSRFKFNSVGNIIIFLFNEKDCRDVYYYIYHYLYKYSCETTTEWFF